MQTRRDVSRTVEDRGQVTIESHNLLFGFSSLSGVFYYHFVVNFSTHVVIWRPTCTSTSRRQARQPFAFDGYTQRAIIIRLLGPRRGWRAGENITGRTRPARA